MTCRYTHLVDGAHVEYFETLLVHETLFPESTLRIPTWRMHRGLIAGYCPRVVPTPAVKSAQAREGHPVQVCHSGITRRVEVR